MHRNGLYSPCGSTDELSNSKVLGFNLERPFWWGQRVLRYTCRCQLYPTNNSFCTSCDILHQHHQCRTRGHGHFV